MKLLLIPIILFFTLTVLPDRPANEWLVYYRDAEGSRKSQLMYTSTMAEAIKTFQSDHKPGHIITCVTNEHWDYCVEREPFPKEALLMPMQAQFCGNRIVGTAQKRFLAKQIRNEGCPEAIWVQIEDDHWLGYGVKVVIAY